MGGRTECNKVVNDNGFSDVMNKTLINLLQTIQGKQRRGNYKYAITIWHKSNGCEIVYCPLM